MKFLMIDGALLRNATFNATMKIILSYIYNLKKSDKVFFGSMDYLASVLGLDLMLLSKNIEVMLRHGYLLQTSEGLTLGCEFEKLVNKLG